MGNVLDALGPEVLVELGIESDVLRAHGLLREIDDGFDCPRCALLEGTAVDALVHVDGVLAGDDVLEGGPGLALLFGAFCCGSLYKGRRSAESEYYWGI